MADCTLTGEVKNIVCTSRARANIRLTVLEVRLDGVAHLTEVLNWHIGPAGTLLDPDNNPAKVAQGASVRISGPVEGFEESYGAWVTIPNLSEYDFNLLVPAENAPSNAVSQAALNAKFEVFTQTIISDTVLDIGDAMRALILIDTTDNDVTVQLQPVANMAHREITFKKIADDNLAIIDCDDSELIDGSLVFNMEMLYEKVRVMPAEGAWWIV